MSPIAVDYYRRNRLRDRAEAEYAADIARRFEAGEADAFDAPAPDMLTDRELMALVSLPEEP